MLTQDPEFYVTAIRYRDRPSGRVVGYRVMSHELVQPIMRYFVSRKFSAKLALAIANNHRDDLIRGAGRTPHA